MSPRDLAAQYEALSFSAPERTALEALAIQRGWAICQDGARTVFGRNGESLTAWWDENHRPWKAAPGAISGADLLDAAVFSAAAAWLRTELRKALAGDTVADAVEEAQ